MRKDRVLIVEDEIIVAKDLQQKLINLGYLVPDIALTGDEAMSKTRTINPDIILMDIKLGGDVDGIDTATNIRKNNDVPIIFLTAYGDESTIERAKLTDPNGYMIKPFNVQELHSNIQLALHKNKLDSQLRRNQEFLFNMIQNMGEAVIATDMDYSVQFLNKNAQIILDISKKEAIGKKIASIVRLCTSDKFEEINVVPSSIKDKLISKNLTKVSNLLLTSSQGKKTIVDEIIAPVIDYDSSQTGFVFIFQDMTERRNTELVLEKINKELERRVAQRTSELFSTNKQLESEILERKKIEKKITTMKESLENIINSTSELIIALDRLNRVEYWNNAAERITGYKKKDVIGRYINKISCIEKPDQFFELIRMVTETEKAYSKQISVITKDYSRKIINVSCSPLHQKKDSAGALIVGRDITYDWQSHQDLIQGHSYLITNKNSISAFDLFTNLVQTDTRGIHITRSLLDKYSNHSPYKNIERWYIGSVSNAKDTVVSTPQELQQTIQDIASLSQKCMFFLEDIHYFITNFSFEEFINTCYIIIDIVSRSHSIFLLSINESILDDHQLAMLESEFEYLPTKKLDDIKMKDELFEIITYIYEENAKNSVVSYKKLMSKFNIVYYTASKRVELLEKEELVYTKKYGKSRLIHLTEKGKMLLHRRKTL